MRWLRYVHPSHIVIFVPGMYFLAAFRQAEIHRGMDLFSRPDKRSAIRQNPEIKIPGFLLFPVQHFDDVVAELGMQRAGWLQFRAGEDHFIEGWYHLAPRNSPRSPPRLPDGQMECFFASLPKSAPFLSCSSRSSASFSSFTRYAVLPRF